MRTFTSLSALALFLGTLTAPASAQQQSTELDAIKRQLAAQQAELQALRERVSQIPRSERLPAIPANFDLTAPAGAPAPAKDAKPKEPYVVGSDTSLKVSWKHGLEAESANKDFRVHVGGRTQFDEVWLTGGANAFDVPPPGSGISGEGDGDAFVFRRARLRVDGTMYEFIDWACEYDFVNTFNSNVGLQPASEANVINVPAPTDLWVNFRNLPMVGNFRIGNMKEPIGFEHLTSSRYLNFMERSFLQDAFTGAFNNGFTPGMMIWDWTESQNATWAAGVFKNNTNPWGWGVDDGEYAVTSRVTWLPWYDEPSKGRYLMHLGLSGSHRDADDGVVRVRTRPSLRNGPGALNPVIADTGNLPADSLDLVGTEAVYQYGSWIVASEYMAGFINDAVVGATPVGTLFVQGYYIETLVFLTGEHRDYDRHYGTWTRVIPHENAYFVRGLGCCGHGAWQLGLRYNVLDLRDTGIDGGYVQDVTVGLNWFLNPNMKFQWNYIYTHRDAAGGIDDNINGIGMRLAYDF